MDWTGFIDIYCERTAPGFWNEPLNALSNLSFILAALWGWAEAHRSQVMTPGLRVAIALAFLIGIGSFLFHTFATAWSELTDVIPIWSFVLWFVLLSIHHIGGVSLTRIGGIAAMTLAVIALVIWMMSSDVTTTPATTAPPVLNGSLQYSPAVIALFAFAAIMWWRGLPTRNWVVAAALAFSVSLVFRTVDLQFCATLPMGTHFVWHLLNGLMIALILQALIRHMAITQPGQSQPS